MDKQDIIYALIGHANINKPPHKDMGDAFAPSNIALAKYWGKRDPELHLPVTPSLSISLGDRGTHTKIAVAEDNKDTIYLNNQLISAESIFASKTSAYLDFFRTKENLHFHVDTTSNIPIGAGVASSASGFAALILALYDLFGWENITDRQLSMLARLGSGSAARSIWQGFVKWHAGFETDGMDCYAEPIEQTWEDLRIALLIISDEPKSIGSREAMARTKETSMLYPAWPKKVNSDLKILKKAIKEKDFTNLGIATESNALAMHGTMLAAWPPIQYSMVQTLESMEKIWALREEGCEVYFTQDAGPNLKFLFLESSSSDILSVFPNLEIIAPFSH